MFVSGVSNICILVATVPLVTVPLVTVSHESFLTGDLQGKGS